MAYQQKEMHERTLVAWVCGGRFIAGECLLIFVGLKGRGAN